MCLFNTHYTKSSRLDEFEQGQMQNVDQIGNYLKDTWAITLKNAIKSSFKVRGPRRAAQGPGAPFPPCLIWLRQQTGCA